MLFYRFISENLTAYLNEQERKAGQPGLRLRRARATTRPSSGARETVAEKGFYILPSELFANVRERARHDENLNETLANGLPQHRGLGGRRRRARTTSRACSTTSTSTSSKLGPTVAKRNEKLVKLLDAIGDLDLGDFADNTIDAVRRRLRVPDDDVRLERRQVRRRVLHAAGGRRSCSPGSPSSARPR